VTDDRQTDYAAEKFVALAGCNRLRRSDFALPLPNELCLFIESKSSVLLLTGVTSRTSTNVFLSIC